MNSKRIAVVTGILFIVATTATIVSQMLLSPLLAGENLVSSISSGSMRLKLGMVFELLNAFASAGIAISLFTILRRTNESFGIGYLGLRLIEGSLGVIAVISYAALFHLIETYSVSSVVPSPEIHRLIDLLINAHDFTFLLVLIAFNIGAFILYPLLFRSKLVPRGIAAWGLVGAFLLAVANIIQFFDVQTNGLLISLLPAPIALNEMALAIWLIVKGFNTPAQE
jgi:hypothetical protein